MANSTPTTCQRYLFFFQAEDGIRDVAVTGVQTCALPILFRRLFLTGLADAHAAGRLAFFGELGGLCSRSAFDASLAPLRKKNWFVYAKPPFADRKSVV